MKTRHHLLDLDKFVDLLENGLMCRLPGLSFSRLCALAGIENVSSFNDYLMEYFGYSGAEIMDIYRE